MNDLQIEKLVADMREKVKEAGRKGDKDLAKAYADNLAAILQMRSAANVRIEEEERGLK